MRADEVRLQKQKTYLKVFDLARDELLASSIQERCTSAGARFTGLKGAGTIELAFFDETIAIEVPEFRFASSLGKNITLAARILILHYLNTASGRQLSGDKVPYGDIPGCRSYLPVFERRTVKPLLNAFGFNRDLFREAGAALGGSIEEFGDASFTLYALPRVPLTYVLWEGDQEFPPSLKVLFDRTISGYLPLEDITVIAKLAATRILKAARRSIPYLDD